MLDCTHDADGRNTLEDFRLGATRVDKEQGLGQSYYYEKVGFRGVEEKKSLEILLKEDPLDLIKLKHFCARFPVLEQYRISMWKVLLGVVPPYQSCREFVMQQRQEQYQDLIRLVTNVLKWSPSEAPLHRTFVLMWLVETRRLCFDRHRQFEDTEVQSMETLAGTLLDMFDDSPIICYWMAKNLKSLSSELEPKYPIFIDLFWTTLEKENARLQQHLVKIGYSKVIPLEIWFRDFFAGILHQSALQRVWDKVLGGSPKVLVFVALALLLTLRMTLITRKLCHEIEASIATAITSTLRVSEDSASQVVLNAFDLGQKHGYLMTS
ncbi:unnamed protein product [Darwinula stevensoni]|uniref:TBC1 domain family member 7 n=1 Tax=Darwinula stevensoni TaxID=69355 RepID=A0A7R8XFH9_9CRUS|nr:unnamed protein product [Darwinula stevensoni]CAG0888844.1 unnamed protein product [Darwinula stevensoni]